MSVLTRLLLIYMVIVLLIAAMGVWMFNFVSRSMEDTLFSNLDGTSARMSQQIDSLIRPMEYTSMHLLSNRRFIMAAKDLIGVDRSVPDNYLAVTMAKNELHSIMMAYSFYKYFHRVSVFNSNWDFFSSQYDTMKDSGYYKTEIEHFKWAELLLEKEGGIVILPPYDDPWDDEARRVFALARSIRGGMGVIEVQQPVSGLDEIFTIGEEGNGVTVCAVTREGSVLYDGGIDSEMLGYYLGLAANLKELEKTRFEPLKNPFTGVSEVFAGTQSTYTGITVLIIQDKHLLLKPLRDLAAQMFTLYLFMVTLSCLFFVLQSWHLVKPLRQLKREMEITRLENLPDGGSVETSNNEIISLSHAFIDLKDRLNELIKRELSLQALHMQAGFDALQTQMNPHFLYNTLGLISNRAAMQNDDDTLLICGSIASMLRYSVNTKSRLVTLKEELLHLEDYIYLMKARYEHRLEFKADIDPAIYHVILPRMVLQPLVENSITHGFANSEGVMKIRISGQSEGEHWHVEISDNGQGFSGKALCSLSEKLAQIDREKDISAKGGELGGLGIANIYARLKLISDGKIHLGFSNSPDGGALTFLSGSLEKIPAKGDNNGLQSAVGR